MAAGIVVFVQFIAEERVDPATQFFLDVGAQRIASLRAADGVVTLRVLRDLSELVDHTGIFRPLEMCFRAVTVYPTIFTDLDPFHLPVRIDR